MNRRSDPRVTQCVEQHPGLLRRAAAEFHQGVGAGCRRRSRPRARAGSRPRPGRVVLRQPGDLIEQVAADRVVEPLGRQRLRCLRAGRRRRRGAARWQRSRRRGGWTATASCTILSARSSSTREPSTVDEVAVGNVLPVRVVVVGFAGQHHAVVPAQHEQGVAPCGGQQSRSVGGQDVQPGIGVGRRRPRRSCRPARRDRGRRSARPAARCRTVDSAAADAGSTARSTSPLCDSSHRPSVNGADADASIGMPTVAERTAATTQPLRSAGATDANDASPHSGAALRQRRGASSVVEEPDAPAVGVHQPVLLPARRIRLHQKAVRRIEHQRCHRYAVHRASPGGDTSDVPGQPDAGEDLPADRVVPVAEARPQDARPPPPTIRRAAPGSRRRRTAGCNSS